MSAPSILIAYGTTDGQTAKIAAAIGATIREQGLAADVLDLKRIHPRTSAYAAVIVAGSVHAGGYQRAVRRWVREEAASLAARPTAFVSVCLGVLQHKPEVDRELAEIQQRFFSATGWRPRAVKVVAGALKYTQYNWLKRWIMKRIVAKATGALDTSRDYEYTDWNDLAAFTRQFASGVSRGERPAA